MLKREREVPTLGVFISELWLPAVRPTVRSSTHYSYVGIFRTHICPALGDERLDEITPQKVNAFYAALLASGHARRQSGLAPSSVIRIHATLHRALRDAVRWDLIQMNPADRADPPKQKTGSLELRTWTRNEVRVFLRTVDQEPDSTYWLLLVMTGMRRGEVLGLRWNDVDLERAVLAVRQTVVSVGGRREFSTPKTARGRRLVALDSRTVQTLAVAWRDAPFESSALVFSDSDGGPLCGPRVSKRFKALASRAGLPEIRLHDLRHTHATLALQAGIHPKIVSERLGHCAVSFTLDVYSHATPHMQGEAAERIGDLISGTT